LCLVLWQKIVRKINNNQNFEWLDYSCHHSRWFERANFIRCRRTRKRKCQSVFCPKSACPTASFTYTSVPDGVRLQADPLCHAMHQKHFEGSTFFVPYFRFCMLMLYILNALFNTQHSGSESLFRLEPVWAFKLQLMIPKS
jgi:hypothetical protein